MIKIFSSLRLTLLLLLLLAVISSVGTFSADQLKGYMPFYQSIWFRTLLGLLAINLIVCTIKSWPGKCHPEHFWQQRLRNLTTGDEISISVESLQERLRSAGYSIEGEVDCLVAFRGRSGRWGAPMVHLAILLVMAGALLAEFGFVGTINTYLREPNQQYFDWDKMQDQALGFTLRAEALRLRYYPIELRFEVVDAINNVNLGRLQRYDNQSFEVPGTDLVGQLRGFDPETKILTIDVYKDGQLLGQYLVGERLEQFGAKRSPGFRLRNLQFRDPNLQQIETDVSLLEAGKVVRQGTIRVNEPLSFRGIDIYQTAYGKDDRGNLTVGFQLSKDPGEGLVWSGLILLMAGLFLAFYVPRRTLGARQLNGRRLLVPLQGWRGETGKKCWAELLQQLSRDVDEETQ